MWKTVDISAFPRIHTSLIDLGGATLRKYGGAGFAISNPKIDITIERGAGASKYSAGLEGVKDDVNSAIMRFSSSIGRSDQYRIRCQWDGRQHSGLGSKTAIVLGVLSGLNLLNETSLTDEQLIQISKRGMTSGVGIRTFFEGGFVVDCGQRSLNAPDNTYLPSSASQNGLGSSLKVLRIEFPISWRIILLIPDGPYKSGDQEIDFFRANTPIPRSEVLEVLGAIYHGVVPALIEEDLGSLRIALAEIVTKGFKAREVAGTGAVSKCILEELMSIDGVASGLSSMGPLLFAIIDATNEGARERILRIATKFEGVTTVEAFARNRGFEVGSLS